MPKQQKLTYAAYQKSLDVVMNKQIEKEIGAALRKAFKESFKKWRNSLA